MATKITVSRAANGFARKEGRLFTDANTFENICLKKLGAEKVKKAGKGNLEALDAKGKVIGVWSEKDETGYAFAKAKLFANFLTKMENGEFVAKGEQQKEKVEQKTTKKKGKDDVPARLTKKDVEKQEKLKKQPIKNNVKATSKKAADALSITDMLEEVKKYMKVSLELIEIKLNALKAENGESDDTDLSDDSDAEDGDSDDELEHDDSDDESDDEDSDDEDSDSDF